MSERESRAAQVKDRIRELVAAEPPGERFVTKVLGRELVLVLRPQPPPRRRARLVPLPPEEG